MDEETDDEDRKEDKLKNPDSIILVTKPILRPSAKAAEDICGAVTVYEPLDEDAQMCRIFSTRIGNSTSSAASESEQTYVTAHDDEVEDHLEIYLEPEMAM